MTETNRVERDIFISRFAGRYNTNIWLGKKTLQVTDISAGNVRGQDV